MSKHILLSFLIAGLIHLSVLFVDAGRVAHDRVCVNYKPTVCAQHGCRFCCDSKDKCGTPKSQAKVVGYYEPKVPFLQAVGTCSHAIRTGAIVIIKVKKIIGAAGHQYVRVDFRSGADERNIALHLSIRVAHHILVRNNLDNGHWGAEETHAGLFPWPFEKSTPFELEIKFDDWGAHIYVDQKKYTSFAFRKGLDLDEIDHIFIDGAVLESVQVWHF